VCHPPLLTPKYLALQRKDIDLQKGTATVQRAVIWRTKGAGWTFAEPKTSKSRPTVPLPVSPVKRLAEHRGEQAERRMKLGPQYENHDLVFAMGKGTPIYYRNLALRHFAPTLERAKLQGFRLYDLRHSCATLLLSHERHCGEASGACPYWALRSGSSGRTHRGACAKGILPYHE
jgi:integrase